MKFSQGDKIDKYIVEELIDEGGSADVYKVFDRSIETHRAIKIVKNSAIEGFADRFLTEARLSSKIDSPYMAKCLSFGRKQVVIEGEISEYPYLVMEYVEGTDLNKYIERHHRIPPDVALAVVACINSVLIKAHSMTITIYSEEHTGIIHRDIKPSNILISSDGDLKLIDFGIAKAGKLDIHTKSEESFVGTYQYAAPEQIQENSEGGTRIDGRADIYALGSVLYEMITGQMLYPQTDMMELMVSKSMGKTNFNLLKPHTKRDKSIEKILKKMVKVDPNDRYNDAYTLQKDINQYFHERKIIDFGEHARQYFIGNKNTVYAAKSFFKPFLYSSPLLLLLAVFSSIVLRNSKSEENTSTSSMKIFPDTIMSPKLTDNKPFKFVVDTITPKTVTDKFIAKKTKTTAKKTTAKKTKTTAKKTKTTAKKTISDKSVISQVNNKNYSSLLKSTGESDIFKIGQLLAKAESGQISSVQTEILNMSTNDGAIYYLKGKVWAYKGHHQRALKEFDRAIKTKSTFKIKSMIREESVKSALSIFKKTPSLENKAIVTKKMDSYRRFLKGRDLFIDSGF